MSVTMKALHWSASRGTIALIDTPAPTDPSAPDQVIVQVAYAGVCGTDIHIMTGEFVGSQDLIMGHEVSGRVVRTGKDVITCREGDAVVVAPNSHCGSCAFCTSGKVNCCVTGGLRSTYGIWRSGGWAEYIEVQANQVNILPEGLSLKQGVLCEPMACVVHGFERCGIIPDDSRILVMGAGIIGLLWASLLHHKGFRDVTITEVSPERLTLAAGLGLGYNVTHPDEVKSKMDAVEPEVEGFDYIIDCTGSARAVEVAFPWMRRGGCYNLFGCCPKKSEMKIQPAEFVLREVTLTGSLISPFAFPKTVKLVTSMAERYLGLEKLGVHVFEMTSYKEGFAVLESGKASKVVFEINSE